jgi:hypothetical protein
MSDLTITAANVVADAGAKIEMKYALEAVTAGESLYQSLTDAKKVGLYDADAAAPANALCGVALNSAGEGQPVAVMSDGVLTIGGTVVQGTIYLGSDTAGGIRPAADLNSGDAVSVLGVAVSTTKLKLNIWNTGVAKS